MSTSPLHFKQDVADGNHIVTSMEFADAASRAAGTPSSPYLGYALTSADIGRAVRQVDDGTFWALKSVGPLVWVPFAAAGDVNGPASATDNAVTRFDGTTGKLLQNSLVTISDPGSIALPVLQTVDGRDVSVDGAYLDQLVTGLQAGTSIGVRPKLNFVSGATVVDNPGQNRLDITISTTTAALVITTPGAYPYTVLVTDDVVLVDTASARTINLPNPATYTKRLTIKDAIGSAGTNAITIARFGSETIDGVAASYVFRAGWGSITFISNLTNWFVQ